MIRNILTVEKFQEGITVSLTTCTRILLSIFFLSSPISPPPSLPHLPPSPLHVPSPPPFVSPSLPPSLPPSLSLSPSLPLFSLQRYLEKSEFGNAKTQQLWDALQSVVEVLYHKPRVAVNRCTGLVLYPLSHYIHVHAHPLKCMKVASLELV